MVDVTARLDAAGAALLVIDLQEKLLPAMHEAEACLAAASKLIAAADVLAVPVLATEQYPAGLGPTCSSIRSLLSNRAPHEKLCFTACVDPVMAQLQARTQVIITGIEAHVCVQQSVLDLLRSGFGVWVCADGVTSRRPLDKQVALERMRQAGAVVTTAESAIFELLGRAGTDQFKQILKIVK